VQVSVVYDGRTNPRHQISMAPRKFMVVLCTFDSNYSWFMCVFAILESLNVVMCGINMH
jgi:hypothetical protein